MNVQARKVHCGITDYFGAKYSIGDVIGCFLDVNDHLISESFFKTCFVHLIC